MAEIARISAVVTANTTQFQRGMKAAEMQTRATAATMKGAGASSAALTAGMNRAGASAKVAAASMKVMKYSLAGIAVTAAIGFKEMQKQEKVSAMTANTLKNLGTGAGFTVEKIEELSKSLGRQTGINHTTIQSAGNLLLGFKALRNDAGLYEKMLTAVMDRSAKTGRDMVSTARAIGFAYQYPVSGIGMLRRAGILLDKETQKNIKTLAEEGKLQRARQLLFEKVAGGAKGAAMDMAKTSTGQIAKLKEQFLQLSEEMAKAVIPALLAIGPPLIDLVKTLAPAFKSVGEAIAAVVQPVATFAAGLLKSSFAAKALTIAFMAFLALGAAAKIAGMVSSVMSLGSAFTRTAATVAGAQAATTAATTAMGAAGAAGSVAATGMASAGGAAAGAAGKVGMFGGALALAATPLGALTIGVGLGIAALFAFRNTTSAGQRALQGFTEAQKGFSTTMAQANAVMTAQTGLTAQITSTTAAAKTARDNLTTAVRNYNTAMAEGRQAGESEAQFQQRIAGLYRTVMGAQIAGTNARVKNNEAIRAGVDNATKLASAGNTELDVARQRVAMANLQANGLGSYAMTAEEARRADANLSNAKAQLSVAEARHGQTLKQNVTSLQATQKAIKSSSMGDQEKAASLEIVNRALSKARSEQKKYADENPPPKKLKVDASGAVREAGKAKGAIEAVPKSRTSKVSVEGAEAAKAVVNPLVAMLNNIPSTVNTTVNATLTKRGGGGFVGQMLGFAGGGLVSGPGGTDRVPAMLTAGEVVLTEKQQRLVNGGMSIQDALRSTGGVTGGGAFATGGKVMSASTASSLIQVQASVTLNVDDVKRAAAETGAYFTRAMQKQMATWTRLLQAAIKAKDSDAITKYGNKIAAATRQLRDHAKALGEVKDRIIEAFTSKVLANFDKNTQTGLNSIRQQFDGYATWVNGVATYVPGKFAELDKRIADSLKSTEQNFSGTWTDMAGTVHSGSFKDLESELNAAMKRIDSELDSALKSINAKYDKLTPSEAQIKALQDFGTTESNQNSVMDAQAALAEAQKWGDPTAILAAQRQLAEAQRTQQISQLQASADAERAQVEAQRAAETAATQAYYDQQRTDTQAFYDGQRTALQGQLDTKLEQIRTAGEAERMLIQADMDAQLAAYEENRANERAKLEKRLTQWGTYFKRLRAMTNGNLNTVLAKFRAFAAAIDGAPSVGTMLSDGIISSLPGIEAAAAKAGMTVEEYLKLNSPAKKGPLSELDHYWDAFSDTLVSGLNMRDIEQRIDEIAELERRAQEDALARANTAQDVNRLTGLAKARSVANANSAVFNLTVQDSTFAGMSRDQADRVARDIQAAIERQVGITL